MQLQNIYRVKSTGKCIGKCKFFQTGKNNEPYMPHISKQPPCDHFSYKQVVMLVDIRNRVFITELPYKNFKL